MYKYLVAFVLISPLIGIYLVEGGEYAPSVGVFGHPNGASLAFACYAVVVAFVAWATSGPSMRLRYASVGDPSLQDEKFKVFAKKLIWINLLFLFVFLFYFDAIRVLIGAVGKGEFRAGLGRLGAFPNLMTKFILPSLLAYAAVLYLRTSRRKKLQLLLAFNFIILFLIGASWGFKTTALLVLLPALLIINWSISFASLIKLSVFVSVTIVIFFIQFDTRFETFDTDADLQKFLLRRLTLIQGDVAWFVWEKYLDGEEFPNYWPTLLAAFGGNVLSTLGPARGDLYHWMLYHYDWMITYIAGVPLGHIAGGHSITATPFAEGLVAGGISGVAFFAVIGGLIAGRMYALIQKALLNGHDTQAAIASTYFCFYVFAWLNGGAVVQLFHVSVWFALGVTIFAIRCMRSRGGRGRKQAAPIAESVQQ